MQLIATGDKMGDEQLGFEIEVSHLGLGAYVMMHGGTLVRMEGRSFVFRTTRTANDWRIEYSNSCCMKHDSLVYELRKYLKD